MTLAYVDVLGNANTAEVTTGGTTAPAAGTSENWIVVEDSALTPFPTTDINQRFRCIDALDIGNLLPCSAGNPTGFEVMLVRRVSSILWVVIRGAENTTPKTHAPNWTAVITETAAGLANLGATVHAFEQGVR